MSETPEGEPLPGPRGVPELAFFVSHAEKEDARRFVPLAEALRIVGQEVQDIVGLLELSPRERLKRDAAESGTPQADLRRRVAQGLRLVKTYHTEVRDRVLPWDWKDEYYTEMELAMRNLADAGYGPRRGERYHVNVALEAERHRRQSYKYRDQGNYVEALAEINQAMGLQPDRLHHYLTRGKIYRLMGDREQALADFQRVLDETSPWDAWDREMTYEHLREMGVEVESKEKEAFLALAKTTDPEAGASQARGRSLSVREADVEDENDQRPLSLKDAYEMIELAVRAMIDWPTVPLEWYHELMRRLEGTPKGRFERKIRRAAGVVTDIAMGLPEEETVREAARETSRKRPLWRHLLSS